MRARVHVRMPVVWVWVGRRAGVAATDLAASVLADGHDAVLEGVQDAHLVRLGARHHRAADLVEPQPPVAGVLPPALPLRSHIPQICSFF